MTIRGLIVQGAGILVLPVLIARGIVRLLRASGQLCRARAIVLFVGTGGFGNTVTAGEAARRLLRSAAPVLVVVSANRFHNPRLGAVWVDLPVVWVDLIWRVRWRGRTVVIGGASERMQAALGRMIRAVLTRWAPEARLLSFYELYHALNTAYPSPAFHARHPTLSWVPAWWRLVQEITVPPSRLPESMAAIIQRRMRRAAGVKDDEPVRLCCVYLRAKDGGGELSSARRSGSAVDAYVPALRRLADAGYLVLVTGDRTLEAHHLAAVGPRVITAAQLKIHPDWFDLFAATACDMWVGDAGGGVWLSAARRVPMLVVNAFPYGYGAPNAWMYYKRVTDAADRPVPAPTLFRDHDYDVQLDGWTVHDNTPEEIDAAVASLLESLRQPGEPPEDAMIRALPDYVMAKLVGSRCSPAWRARLGEESWAEAASRATAGAAHAG